MKTKLLQYLENKKLAKNTISSYKNILFPLIDLGVEGISDNKEFVQLVIKYLKTKEHLSSSSINDLYKPVIMHIFTGFLLDEYSLDFYVTKKHLANCNGIKKISKRAIHSSDDITKLLKKLIEKKENEKDITRKINLSTLILLISFCSTTALRISDVFSINLLDLYKKDGLTIVQQKTKKERYIILSMFQDDIEEIYQYYKLIFNDRNIPPTVKLFQWHDDCFLYGTVDDTYHSTPLDKKTIRKFGVEFLDEEEKKFLLFHGYRRGYATEAVESSEEDGEDIARVALSHSTLEQTQVYISDLQKQKTEEGYRKKNEENMRMHYARIRGCKI